MYLNHLYVVLDSETYQAIEGDDFLRCRFAPNERRTTVRTDETYSGLYFYGRNTYFEVFDVADAPRHAIGDYALAFGVDEAGGLATLRDRFGGELAPPDLITRLYDGAQIPWFYMATVPRFPFRSGAGMWLMEYHADFLTRWHSRPEARDRGVRRREILARYVEAVGPVDTPALVDVVGVTVAADPTARTNYMTIGAAAGYRVERFASNDHVVLNGPDITIEVVPPAGSGEGVRRIQMRIDGPPWTPPSRRLGRATLASDAGHATITFD